jgi:hypothetical protein
MQTNPTREHLIQEAVLTVARVNYPCTYLLRGRADAVLKLGDEPRHHAEVVRAFRLLSALRGVA